MKKILTYTLIIFCFVSNLFCKKSEASTCQPIISISLLETPNPLNTENYEWCYKIESGKIYKRLFDRNNNCWIGNWIYVRDI
ncbi:hypothetical protein DWY36_13720 [Firmicutes bacterium AF25-13AC]|nr:hypothetical protein DWY36_13720 [Firmicutes bacterium AF25-13AC]